MKHHYILYVFLLVLLHSCQVYRYNFDCPPGCGVPCASVSQIEKMIVETCEGPDIFLGYIPQDCCAYPICPYCSEIHSDSYKVWVMPKTHPQGCFEGGHYLYIPKKGSP